MTAARHAWVMALLAAAALAGCTQSSPVHRGYTKDSAPGTMISYVSVPRLAQDLRMSVVSTSACHATLRSPSNFVVVYPDPNGQIFVNGKVIAASGAIVQEGEMLIPSCVQQQVRQAMVPEPALVPVIATPANSQKTQVTTIVDAPRQAGGYVMIDPGHGGNDPGAQSVLGYWEAPVVLAVGQRVRDTLKGTGTTVEMTRDSSETKLDKHDRAALSTRKRPDLYVSIHADWAERAGADGYTVYVSRGAGARSQAAAQAISRSLARAGFTRHSTNVIEKADYVVLKDNSQPAVLVELGYLSNRGDAARLNDADWQAKYAAAVQEGIVDFLRSINATARR